MKNNMAVFDISNAANPIQSVMFDGLDYTFIEESSIWDQSNYPAEFLHERNETCRFFSSEFGGISKYPTERFNGKLITYLSGYGYLINNGLDNGYNLPKEEIVETLKSYHDILMIPYSDYDSKEYPSCILSEDYNLIKISEYYVILIRKGSDIKLKF